MKMISESVMKGSSRTFSRSFHVPAVLFACVLCFSLVPSMAFAGERQTSNQEMITASVDDNASVQGWWQIMREGGVRIYHFTGDDVYYYNAKNPTTKVGWDLEDVTVTLVSQSKFSSTYEKNGHLEGKTISSKDGPCYIISASAFGSESYYQFMDAPDVLAPSDGTTMGFGRISPSAVLLAAAEQYENSGPTPKGDKVVMHRLYNPNSGEHFYTADEGEKDYLSGIGWQYEGVGWTAPSTSGRPVYRLYNRGAGDHHYTLDANEREYLIGIGWEDEDVGWYSYSEDGVPLYRQFNPNATGAGAHNYTADINERDWLVNNGWNDEGIGWYGIPADAE